MGRDIFFTERLQAVFFVTFSNIRGVLFLNSVISNLQHVANAFLFCLFCLIYAIRKVNAIIKYFQIVPSYMFRFKTGLNDKR